MGMKLLCKGTLPDRLGLDLPSNSQPSRNRATSQYLKSQIKDTLNVNVYIQTCIADNHRSAVTAEWRRKKHKKSIFSIFLGLNSSIKRFVIFFRKSVDFSRFSPSNHWCRILFLQMTLVKWDLENFATKVEGRPKKLVDSVEPTPKTTEDTIGVAAGRLDERGGGFSSLRWTLAKWRALVSRTTLNYILSMRPTFYSDIFKVFSIFVKENSKNWNSC